MYLRNPKSKGVYKQTYNKSVPLLTYFQNRYLQLTRKRNVLSDKTMGNKLETDIETNKEKHELRFSQEGRDRPNVYLFFTENFGGTLK